MNTNAVATIIQRLLTVAALVATVVDNSNRVVVVAVISSIV
jgi:hypothetical protein